MKIALVTARRDPFISPYDMDGGCVVLRNYIKELYKLGHEVTVFTRMERVSPLNDKKTNAKARMQKRHNTGRVVVNEGVTIYRIPYKRAFDIDKTEISQFIEAGSFTINLEKYLNANDFDIIHYFHLMSISGWLINKKRIPHLDKTLFSPLLITRGRTFQFPVKERLQLEKVIFNQCRYIVCQSEGELRQIKKYYGINSAKLFKIPLGVDKNIFYPKSEFNFSKKNRLIIINPNSIRPQKGQIDLVGIVKILRANGIRSLVLLVGNESDRTYTKKLQRSILDSGLTFSKLKKFSEKSCNKTKTDFVFLRSQKEVKLAHIIRYSHISVFTSKDEGFSLSTINCMACGTLPFCYDLPAYRDYVIPGENAVVASQSSGYKGIARTILKIINNKPLLLRLSKTAVNVSNNFTWFVLIKRQLAIYRNIKNKTPIKHITYNSLKNWVNLSDGKIIK